jgi:hypothetical protein
VDGLSAVSLDVASIASAQLAYIQPQQKHPHPAMDAAAKLLGMSSSDLRTALQSGQSLVSIASSKGISQDALVGAMASAIQEANPDISADQATKVATAIATRTPHAGSAPGAQAGDAAAGAASSGGAAGAAATSHKHGHHRHHAAAAAMDAAAKALGTTTSDLVSSLQSGQSLATIASAKGVSQDDLVKAISSALSQADSSLSTDQATQLATAMVTGPATPDPSRQWSTAPAGTASTFAILA